MLLAQRAPSQPSRPAKRPSEFMMVRATQISRLTEQRAAVASQREEAAGAALRCLGATSLPLCIGRASRNSALLDRRACGLLACGDPVPEERNQMYA